MKFNTKHIAITAGLGAVLALSPVVGPVSTAFAVENGAAGQSASTESHEVVVYVNGSNYGNWAMPGYAANVSDFPKGDAPEGQEFTGLWTVTWKDGSITTGKSFDDLKGDWAGVVSITAEYKDVEQGGETEQPAEPAQQIDVTFKYDNTSVATTADENGNIDADALGLPDNYTWSWTDSEGVVHEFGSDMLDRYIFTESCVVTGTANEAEQPVSDYVTVHLEDSDGTPIRDVVVQRNTSNWSGVLTDPVKEGYVFVGWQQEGASDIVTDLESVVMGVDDSVNEITFRAVWKEAEPENREIKVNYYDGDKLLGTGSVFNGTSQWSGIANPTKDGYTFLGWSFEGDDAIYSDEALDNLVYAADEQVTEIDLYAQWQKDEAPVDEQRYITVNYYDGDELLGTGAVLNGTSQWSGIVNPQKDGYTFTGWNFEGEDAVYTDAELDGVVYAADPSVTEINLYANWEEIPEEARYITVHFYDEFGNFLGDGAVLNGTSDWSGPIDAPEVDGYTFVGWAEEGGSVYAPELLGQVVVAVPDDVTELTYIAHYEQNADPETVYHMVTFDDCLESTTNQVVEVEDGKTVAKPADPTCEGWTFLGWYTDTELTQEFDFTTPITADMTLYAKWQQNADEQPGTGEEGSGDETETPTTPGESTETPVPDEQDGVQAADKATDENGLPQTGDIAAVAVAGTGALGAAIAGIGAFVGKRRK